MQNLCNKIEEMPKDKKLVVFDLDGTLAESKSDTDSEMAGLLKDLLQKYKVAVIGGGKYEMFQRQLMSRVDFPEDLMKKLFLFPVTATSFYQCDGGQWKCVYSMEFSAEEKKKIMDAFDKIFADLNYHPEDVYWKVVEDRGSEITFSALGQNAPVDLKTAWSKENTGLKLKMVEILQKYLPDMEVRAAGFTSIDVTRKGIDKEYGLKQIKDRLGVDFGEMIFVGDALFPGGNDEAVLRTDVICFAVKNPEDTKNLIRHLLS